MADTTPFTKRDREFIITLANTIDKLRKDFDEHVASQKSEQSQPVKEKHQKKVLYKDDEAPVIHAEFYRTDNEAVRTHQYILIESLEQTLRELCKNNGIAYLSVEIDDRDD